jgi:hypothetical protein
MKTGKGAPSAVQGERYPIGDTRTRRSPPGRITTLGSIRQPLLPKTPQ